LQHVFKAALDHYVADPSAPVALFQFVDGGAVGIERIKVCKDDIAFNDSGIGCAQVVWVSVHAIYESANLVRRGGKRNRVTLRLAHFRFSIDAGQSPRRGN
jgi:hypothetical protein